MDYAAVPQFLADLADRKLSISRLAFELLILTATRSGEVRGARWSELNSDLTIWTIPAERMKMGKAHAIPLSAQAAEIFRQASKFRMACTDLVFPGQKPRNPMSDMTLLQLVRGMDVPVDLATAPTQAPPASICLPLHNHRRHRECEAQDERVCVRKACHWPSARSFPSNSPNRSIHCWGVTCSISPLSESNGFEV